MKRVSAVLGSAAIIVAGACSTFSSAEDPPAGTPDASTGDTGATVQDGAPGDAAVDVAQDADAAVACNQTTPVFADDFASGFDSKWNVAAAGCPLPITDLDAGNGRVVSTCDSQVLESYAVINAKQMNQLARGEITFSFRLSGPKHTFAQLQRFYGPNGDNLTLNGGPLGIEIRRKTTSELVASWSKNPGNAQHVMTISFAPADAGTGFSASASLDGEARTFLVVPDVDAGAPANALRVEPQLGVFLTSDTGVFDSAYDDVRIWACP